MLVIMSSVMHAGGDELAKIKEKIESETEGLKSQEKSLETLTKMESGFLAYSFMENSLKDTDRILKIWDESRTQLALRVKDCEGLDTLLATIKTTEEPIISSITKNKAIIRQRMDEFNRKQLVQHALSATVILGAITYWYLK